MIYKLTFLETVEHRHEVTIETDFEGDPLCDSIEDELSGASGIHEVVIQMQHNKPISDMLKVLSFEEDGSGQAKWEIEDYEVVKENLANE